MSAALGVYVASVSEFAFANVPVPLDVHITPLLFVALAPAVIFTAPELEQVDTAVPATAVGGAFIVSVLVEVAFPQGEFPLAVKVSITLPAVMSAVLGAYLAFVSEVGLVNVPVPLDVHNTPVLFVALAPAVIFTDGELEQVDTAVPATAVGRALIVKGADAPTPVLPLKEGLFELKAIL
jgi:hypothetical protein